MWYGFYNATASESAAFEGKIEELCRELGDRCRANALPAPSSSPTPRSQERSALEGMRLSELKQRAVAVGLAEETVDGVDNADDPKDALIATLLALPASAVAGAGARRQELELLKLSALKRLAVAAGTPRELVGGVDDVDDPKQAAIAIVLDAEAVAYPPRPEPRA
jgi:hypothetical protein